MAQATDIEWASHSWNPVVGCDVCSPGCANCYAMAQAARLLDKSGSHYAGTTKRVNGRAVWTGKIAMAPAHIVAAPLRWRKPRLVFVNSMSDLFHESLPLGWIDRVFAIMARTPQHQFLVLTKRAARMREYLSDAELADRLSDHIDFDWRYNRRGEPIVRLPLPNVWTGVSVEDQRRADERIPHLSATLAAVRWISGEPLLGPVDLDPWLADLDWVVVGGESGQGARGMAADWARSMIRQCQNAHIPVFMKQLGAAFSDPKNGIAGAALQVPYDAKSLVRRRLKNRKGADPMEWPPDLRVREFPVIAK